MFNRRKLYFHKRWINDEENGKFNIITDAALTSTIIEVAQYYNLKVKKIYLSNICECKVVVSGDKDAFIMFVAKVLAKEAKYLEQIKF